MSEVKTSETVLSAGKSVGRIDAIDSLRGIAVILMVQQHLGAWLWDFPWSRIRTGFSEHPLFITLNGLGGFAAPLFILLAGAGAVLFLRNHTAAALIKRGFALIAFGYALNILVPSWFSAGSWYVLHCIGFSFFLGAAGRKISNVILSIACVAVLVSAIGLQTWLNTPAVLTNERMGDYTLHGAIVRLAFVEGHFPIFPWAGLFCAGMLCGRWILKERCDRIIMLASVFVLSGGMLIVGGTILADQPHGSFLFRLVTFSPRIYPVFAPTLLLLSGASICMLYLFLRLRSLQTPLVNPLTCLGRTSLSWLIVHVVVFREIGLRIGIHATLSSVQTLLVTAIIIAGMIGLSMAWKHAGYKYGAEWLLRKI
jgi:uncharacterized membrane protein